MERQDVASSTALSIANGWTLSPKAIGHWFVSRTPVFMGAALGAILIYGWLIRDDEYLTPKNGLGYWLGIYGGTAMLLLLVYSFRKRFKWLQILGPIPAWFRVHMVLGIFGPLLIVFHSNFKLGSLNSNVAFLTMLVVAISGVVGRYLYAKIHVGLYGHKAVANEIIAEAEVLRQSLGHELQAADYVAEQLKAFGNRTNANLPSGLLSSLWAGAVLSIHARVVRRRLLEEVERLIRVEGRKRNWSFMQRRRYFRRVKEIVGMYFHSVLKAAELTFFERLFALWHIFHLPLFFLMLLAAVVHVWAVHQF